MTNGFFSRIGDEIGHWRRSDWTFADVGTFWDGVAEEYDEINSHTVSYFRRFLDTLRLADLPDHSYFLDICSRTGNGTAFFSKHGKVKSAVCADVSEKMGEICQKRLEENGVKDFKWTLIQDYSLPFPDCEFDVVLCLETVEHVSKPEQLVKDLGRVIKPNGVMILSTPNVLWEAVHAFAAVMKIHHSEGPHRFIRYRRLVNLIQDAGFRIDTAQTTVLVPQGPAWLVRIGDIIEDRFRNTLMPLIGLRRIFVCRRVEEGKIH